MDLQSFLQAPPDSSQVAVASATELEIALRSLDRQTGEFIEVRFLRGKKMRTKEGLLNEFASALQFPYFFGENWDALRDALSSLPLLRSGSLLVCIWDAFEVLKESTPEDRETLAHVLEQVSIDRSRKQHTNSLQWAWQVTADRETEFRQEWMRVGFV